MHPKINNAEPSWLGRTLMAVGISGAAFAALCCFAPFLLAGFDFDGASCRVYQSCWAGLFPLAATSARLKHRRLNPYRWRVWTETRLFNESTTRKRRRPVQRTPLWSHRWNCRFRRSCVEARECCLVGLRYGLGSDLRSTGAFRPCQSPRAAVWSGILAGWR